MKFVSDLEMIFNDCSKNELFKKRTNENKFLNFVGE